MYICLLIDVYVEIYCSYFKQQAHDNLAKSRKYKTLADAWYLNHAIVNKNGGRGMI